MTPLLVTGATPCRRCGAPVDVAARAALLPTTTRVLVDCACGACGHRALYPCP